MTAVKLVLSDSIGGGVVSACQIAAERGSKGIVVGVFSFGFYVRVAGQIFAVGGPRLPAGPVHLVLETAPPLPREQSEVWLTQTKLWTQACTVDLSSATRYWPSLPSHNHLELVTPRLAKLATRIGIPQDLKTVWSDVIEVVKCADLGAAAEQLEGRGQGLTPTGDDVLAGLLLMAHWRNPKSDFPGEIAGRAQTSELSRSFLTWAARGQSIQPVHELLDSAFLSRSSTNHVDRFDRAVEQVASIGASSGKALLAGLSLSSAFCSPLAGVGAE